MGERLALRRILHNVAWGWVMKKRKMPTAIGRQMDKRLDQIEEATEDDGAHARMQERGEDIPAAVYTKPETTKVFSDGSVRRWDDYEQGWVVVKPAE